MWHLSSIICPPYTPVRPDIAVNEAVSTRGQARLPDRFHYLCLLNNTVCGTHVSVVKRKYCSWNNTGSICSWKAYRTQMTKTSLSLFYRNHVRQIIPHRLPRDNQRDREKQTLLKLISSHRSKYLSGKNLPRISLIRGKLLQDRHLHPIPTC